MREFKFRAWFKDTKIMSLDFDLACGQWRIDATSPIDDEYYKQELSNADAIMQYTGLKDKNDVEIYEGDIVRRKHEEGVAVVKFGEGVQGEPADGMYPYWGWYTDGWLCSFAFGDGDLEVIGNIYENPELLGKDK